MSSQGLHLITQSTPNGQAVQIFLEVGVDVGIVAHGRADMVEQELKDVYGLEWTTTLIKISTNEQKKEWFLRLDPNGNVHISCGALERGLNEF